MPTYSFKITKGKYQLSLSTTDKELIVDQFEKWVRKASEYVQKRKNRAGMDRVTSQINAEKELTQKKIDEQLKRMPKPEPVEEQPISQSEETQKNLDVFYAPPKQQQVETVVHSNEPVGFDNILDNKMQTPQTELSFKPTPSIKNLRPYDEILHTKQQMTKKR